ncbi:hypothetical protein GSB9_01779 [Flavobacteriaceae bacterium GSB9]|nr:hypothetical protein GSB9_01779 [Flavobacteriaceae bacterium GSB9]
MRHLITLFLFLVGFCIGFSQDNRQSNQQSNIQTYTPSKLLKKGQWDIKWFNNLYTETEDLFGDNGTKRSIPRNTFFTSTIDVFSGISDNNNFNIGVLLEFRSNVVSGRNTFDVFKFDGASNSARSGFTSIAPAIKFNPIKTISNFTVQTAFHIPLIDNEVENGVYLDQKGFILQNRFFYDYSFANGDWQLFSELNTELNFGKKENSFANNSLRLTPGVFLSYFPSSKFTVLALVQHAQLLDLGNNFSQDFTAVGGGAKYQLNSVLNIEALYTNFIRGTSTGLGQTFNLGLRALF